VDSQPLIPPRPDIPATSINLDIQEVLDPSHPLAAEVLSASAPWEAWLAARRKQAAEASLYGGLPISRRAAFIKEHMPHAIKGILVQADFARAGMLRLPGCTERQFIGDPPDWTSIRHGDKESVWALNRHGAWASLGLAWRLTGDETYAAEAIRQFVHWVDTCPVDPYRDLPDFVQRCGGVHPWRILECGMRMFVSWWMFFESCVNSPAFTVEVFQRYVASLRTHAAWVLDLSPRCWPEADHNHFIMEMLGVQAVATHFPELRGASAWCAFTVQQHNRSALRQISIDGGHIEGCPSYHNDCVELFCRAARLAALSGLPLAPEAMDRIVRMSDYGIHAMRPDGRTAPCGDSDPNLSSAEASICQWILTEQDDALRVVLRAMGPAPVRGAAVQMLPIIPSPENLLAVLDSLEAENTPVRSERVFFDRELHHATVRTPGDWTPDDTWLFFACKLPVCPGSNHSHIDPASFEFFSRRTALVVDPGRYTYRDGDDRYQFKSAAYHSTLLINNRDPFEYISSFVYGPQREACVTQRIEGPSYVAFAATNRSYEPTIHHRLVCLDQGGTLMVVDAVDHVDARSTVDRYFHLDTPRVEWAAAEGIARATYESGVILHIRTEGLARGECLPGRVSPQIDVWHPSTRLHLTDDCSEGGRRFYVAVLAAGADGEDLPTAVRLWPDSAGADITLGHSVYTMTCTEGVWSIDRSRR
jgi:hypothetical protein